MYFTTSFFMGSAMSVTSRLVDVGNVRELMAVSALDTRSASLYHLQSTPPPNASDVTSASLKSVLTGIYDEVVADSASNLWQQTDLDVLEYAGSDQWYSERKNLLEASAVLVADTVFYAAGPDDYHNNSHWRYVMDNAVLRIIPRLDNVQYELLAATDDAMQMFLFIQLGLAALLVITLLVMSVGILWRALRRVRTIKRAVVEIAAALPPLTVASMRRSTASARAFIKLARVVLLQQIEAEGHEEDVDRGVGPVEGFTVRVFCQAVCVL